MKTYYPTGNEYIALPTIREDGAIESLNYVSMRDRGMIEMTGKPFLTPFIKMNEKTMPMDNLDWTWDSYWIPTFKTKWNDIEVTGRYIAPKQTKGWFLRLELQTEGDKEPSEPVETGIIGQFGPVLHSINETKDIVGLRVGYESLWNQSFVFDFRTGVTMFSFGFITDGGFSTQSWDEAKQEFELRKTVHWIPSGEGYRATVDIYMGVGFEEVGATTQAIHMMRETGDHLYKALKSWLEKRVIEIENGHIKTIANLNQFFNYFYATGRTLDTEELILCTSRSPRYYVSAAYWDRDSLIWSFPSLLSTDIGTAKEALEYVFTKQIRNIGIHSRYVDGTVLEPGFELDELCAPLLALEQYFDKSHDKAFLEETFVRKGIEHVRTRLLEWKHPHIDLFGTFLMPTDDMRRYPYLTYNNVLVWKALKILHKLYEATGQSILSHWALDLSSKVEQAIWTHLVSEKNGQKFFVWSSDLAGNHDFYDEPPGSLTLLSYYEFVSPDNEVFKNTVNKLYSIAFPHYFYKTKFEELGCSHADHPWILALCNSLLNGRHKEAIDMLMRTKMDNYIACESIHEHTGEWVTGAHFATCAGFLVHAINTARRDGHI